MKFASKILYVLALTLIASAVVSPAQAERMFPCQHQIEARQIVASHQLNHGAMMAEAEASQIDTVIMFASNSDKLTPTAKMQIKKVASMLKSPDMAGTHVMVNGYTDSAGKPVRNQRLSYHRALRGMHALIADGVPSTMLSAQGYGKESPVATNATPTGRAMNRRVSFTVISQAGM